MLGAEAMSAINYDAELNGHAKNRKKERAALALKLRRDGLIYRDIGEQLGVKAETARQLAMHGLRLEFWAAKPR
jgi:hypothetical protein